MPPLILTASQTYSIAPYGRSVVALDQVRWRVREEPEDLIQRKPLLGSHRSAQLVERLDPSVGLPRRDPASTVARA